MFPHNLRGDWGSREGHVSLVAHLVENYSGIDCDQQPKLGEAHTNSSVQKSVRVVVRNPKPTELRIGVLMLSSLYFDLSVNGNSSSEKDRENPARVVVTVSDPWTEELSNPNVDNLDSLLSLDDKGFGSCIVLVLRDVANLND